MPADYDEAEIEREFAETGEAYRRATREYEAVAKKAAIVRAHRAVVALAERGVRLRVGGRLAQGRFKVGELIEFVVLACPRELRGDISRLVEDYTLGRKEESGGFEALVRFLDDIPADRREWALDTSMDAADLKRLLASCGSGASC